MWPKCFLMIQLMLMVPLLITLLSSRYSLHEHQAQSGSKKEQVFRAEHIHRYVSNLSLSNSAAQHVLSWEQEASR